MRTFAILFRKELAAYLHTSAAATVAAVFLALSGLTVWVQTLQLSQGILPPSFWARPEPLFWLAMLATAPLLTMHLFAEERRTGELEMRLAAPVTEAQVVLAKFAAALALWAVAWIPVLFYPLLLRLADAGWAPAEVPSGAAVFYAGGILVGASFLAVGLFASLMTRRPVVAAMLAVAALGTAVAAGLWPLPAALRPPPDLESLLSPVAHMRDFASGVVDTRAVVWHLSSTALVLFLATKLLEARRAR